MTKDSEAKDLDAQNPSDDIGSMSAGRVFKHLANLFFHFFGTRTVHIASEIDRETVVSRINRLEKNKEVEVTTKPEGPDYKLSVIRRYANSRVNVLPVFNGTLTETDGQTVLDGTIRMDSGIQVVIGFFALVIFVFLPLRMILNASLVKLGDLGNSGAGILVLAGLLEFCYLYGMGDSTTIIHNLEAAMAAKNRDLTPV